MGPMKTDPMNIRGLAAMAAAALGLALLTSGCSKKEQVAAVQPAPQQAQAAPAPEARTVAALPQPVAVAATASWESLADLTYDQRAEFIAGILRLENQLDGQIGALAAKRATMTTDTKDWDFAMGGLTEARSYLQSMATEVGAATPDTWSEEKEKAHQAWLKAQDAYDKVRTSTTS